MKLLKPLALTLGISLMSSSCVGNFMLFNKLAQWNLKSIQDKWLAEIIFVGLTIIPVYPICYAADALVFNSIEFWTGDNPIKDVKLGSSDEYRLKKNDDGIVYLENNNGLKLEAKLVAKDTVLFTDASGNEVEVKKMGDKFQNYSSWKTKYFRPHSTKIAVNQ